MYLVQIIVAKQIKDVLYLYVHKFHATPSILRPQYHFHREYKNPFRANDKNTFQTDMGMYILFQKLT